MSHEEQNLEFVERYVHLYNTDVHKFIDEFYAQDAEIIAMGVTTFKTKEQDLKRFHDLEASILETTPDRKIRVDHSLAKDNMLVLEGVFSGSHQQTGKAYDTPFCAVLTLRDGQVLLDRTYLHDTPVEADQ